MANSASDYQLPDGVEFGDTVVCVTDRGEISWSAPESRAEYDEHREEFDFAGGRLDGPEELKRNAFQALYSESDLIDIGRKAKYEFTQGRHSRADIAACLASVNPGRGFLDTASLRALDAVYESGLERPSDPKAKGA